MKLEDMLLTGELEGYQQRDPKDPETARIDAQAAGAAPCVKDGGEMSYVPFIKDGSYRAFAVCRTCGHTVEF